MTLAIVEMTVGTNAQAMGPVLVASANVIRAISELTAIRSARDMAHVIMALVTAAVNGRVITAKSQNVLTTALETASATALFSHVFVTQAGVDWTAASLTALVNRIVIIEVPAHRLMVLLCVSTAVLVGWALPVMILVSTVYKSQWTVDFVSAIPAGLARAVMLYVWAEVRAPIMEFASVILSKAGEETFAKFLDVLVLVRIVRVMVTVTALHTSAHVTRDGLVWDAIFLIVQGRQTAITAATVMRLLLPHNVRTAVEAGWELHVLILVRLESKLQWTVDSVFVGLDTQVKIQISAGLSI